MLHHGCIHVPSPPLCANMTCNNYSYIQRFCFIQELISETYFQLDSPKWEFISDYAKDLVRQMLTVDPKQRLSIQEVLNHKWLRVSCMILAIVIVLNAGFGLKDRDKGKIHLTETVDELKKFNARRKLKAAILAAVNSSKWYPYDDPNADSFSDLGDEEVSSCGE